jgi:hypothetical protein
MAPSYLNMPLDELAGEWPLYGSQLEALDAQAPGLNQTFEEENALANQTYSPGMDEALAGAILRALPGLLGAALAGKKGAQAGLEAGQEGGLLYSAQQAKQATASQALHKSRAEIARELIKNNRERKEKIGDTMHQSALQKEIAAQSDKRAHEDKMDLARLIAGKDATGLGATNPDATGAAATPQAHNAAPPDADPNAIPAAATPPAQPGQYQSQVPRNVVDALTQNGIPLDVDGPAAKGGLGLIGDAVGAEKGRSDIAQNEQSMAMKQPTLDRHNNTTIKMGGVILDNARPLTDEEIKVADNIGQAVSNVVIPLDKALDIVNSNNAIVRSFTNIGDKLDRAMLFAGMSTPAMFKTGIEGSGATNATGLVKEIIKANPAPGMKWSELLAQLPFNDDMAKQLQTLRQDMMDYGMNNLVTTTGAFKLRQPKLAGGDPVDAAASDARAKQLMQQYLAKNRSGQAGGVK